MRVSACVLLCLLIGAVMGSVPAAAQDGGIWVEGQSVESAFRDHITFEIAVTSDEPIESIQLLYKIESIGLSVTSRGDAEFGPGADVRATFVVDQEKDYFPPGSELEYWWKITDVTGETLTTDHETFTYFDERQDWKSLSNDRIALYWYRGADDFGEALFDRTNATLDQIEREAGVQVSMPIKIFIYGSHVDLMDAIDVGAQEWTGGLAFTEQGVIVLGVGPGDLDFALVALPHELTHLVIHQATDNPFGDLPTWLDEGLAVYMSGELDASWRGYRELVKKRARNDALISLQTLSSNFPADPEAASQSYAQSGIIVEYIIDSFGTDTMNDLLDIFAEGSTYDDALTQVLGLDTWELDNAWRQSIGAPAVVSGSGDAASDLGSEHATGSGGDQPAAQEDQEVDLVSGGRGDSLPEVGLPCMGSLAVVILALLALWTRPGGIAGS
jgi:hypothetical protein